MGGDYSSMYDLDSENAKKLRKLMRRKCPFLSFKRALIVHVGKNLNDEKFQKLLSKNDIKYTHSTLLS